MGNPLAIPGAIAAGVTGLNQVASLFGLNSSDPVRDQQRIDRINQAFNLAMAGNLSPQSNLNGMTGIDYLRYIATNDGGRGNPPVYGSQIAYRFAQAKWAEYQGRHAAGVVGGGLIGQSDIPTQIIGTVQQIASNPLVLAGIVVGGYLLLSKRGRR